MLAATARLRSCILDAWDNTVSMSVRNGVRYREGTYLMNELK